MTYATKARTLDDIAADSHAFSIIAMDQRNTLRRMFTAVGLDASDDDLRVAKADVARVLTPAASGLLSDPTYGVPAITAAKALAPGCGLLVAAEPAERRSHQGEPRTHRDPALDARWVMDQGGDALKFFVQLRADRPAPGPGEPDLVAEALAVCEEIIRDGRSAGVPVVIENLVYARPGEDLRGQAREDAIIEAARALNDLDIDCSSWSIPVRRQDAGGWRQSCTGPGPSCPRACRSTSSPTSSGSPPTKAVPRVSSPAARCGARWSVWPARTARSSSPRWRGRDWKG
jgi:tagatose-1,6-bisphosphate aldolase